jgi:putative DNA primase/helicase
MLITPVIRGVVPMAPMHAVTAPTPGSGKSYLSRLASLIATGAPCPVIPPASEPEEFEKRLTSALLHGTPIISLDNIVQRLSSPLLCQALTEPVIDVRPLGASAMARIEQRVTFFANGNNLTIVDDLTRRCLLASVDRNEENPEEHEYSNRPHQLIVEDRGKYVHACLTVVSSYMKTKRAAKLPPLANYEDWSRTVREALVWLGYDDPVMTMRNLRENDPERNKREAIFANWPQDALNHDGIAVNLLTVADLIEAPGQSSGDLSGWQDALKLVASTAKGEVDKREFGRWLGKQKGKVVAGKKLVAVMDKKKKILKWGCMVVADGMVGEQSDLF